MMRAVAIALVLANLVLLAWWQGWLDRWYAPQRDPQRISAQVAPQKLRVVPLERVDKALEQRALTCREVGPLDEATLARVIAWSASQGEAAHGERSGAVYRVRFPAGTPKDDLGRRLAELAAVAGREPIPCAPGAS